MCLKLLALNRDPRDKIGTLGSKNRDQNEKNGKRDPMGTKIVKKVPIGH